MAATALCQEMRHKPKIDEHVRASACVARNKRLKKQKKQKIISKDSHFRTEEFAAKLVQAGKVAVAVVKPGRGGHEVLRLRKAVGTDRAEVRQDVMPFKCFENVPSFIAEKGKE